MKYQVLLSLKNYEKYARLSSAAVVIGALRVNRSEQTVKTLIRLLQKEQSDQGIHCSPFHLLPLD